MSFCLKPNIRLDEILSLTDSSFAATVLRAARQAQAKEEADKAAAEQRDRVSSFGLRVS